MMFEGPTVFSHIQNGSVRAIAVTSPKRLAALPNVPTMAEAGVPGYEIQAWQAIWVPAGVPKPIVNRLYTEVAAILKEPDTVARLEQDGRDAVGHDARGLCRLPEVGSREVGPVDQVRRHQGGLKTRAAVKASAPALPAAAPGWRPATAQDIARAAGVSVASVSRVLNNTGRVGALTRERILKIAAELHYAPNAAARTLASRRSRTVGAVIPSLENLNFAIGIDRFRKVLRERGYTLLLASWITTTTRKKRRSRPWRRTASTR